MCLKKRRMQIGANWRIRTNNPCAAANAAFCEITVASYQMHGTNIQGNLRKKISSTSKPVPRVIETFYPIPDHRGPNLPWGHAPAKVPGEPVWRLWKARKPMSGWGYATPPAHTAPQTL